MGASTEMVSDAVNRIASWFLSMFQTDDITGDAESAISSNELIVTIDESAETETLKAKLKVVQDKISARQEEIMSAISSSETAIEDSVDSFLWDNDIESSIPLLYYDNEIYPSWTDADVSSVSVMYTSSALPEEDAIPLLSLYMVQSGGSLEDINLSTLMKWCGYRDSSVETGYSTFTVAGLNISVPTWKGTFLPQYFYEEADADKEYFSSHPEEEIDPETGETTRVDYTVSAAKFRQNLMDKYGISTVDLLCTVYPQELEDVTPYYSTETKVYPFNDWYTSNVKVKTYEEKLKEVSVPYENYTTQFPISSAQTIHYLSSGNITRGYFYCQTCHKNHGIAVDSSSDSVGTPPENIDIVQVANVTYSSGTTPEWVSYTPKQWKETSSEDLTSSHLSSMIGVETAIPSEHPTSTSSASSKVAYAIANSVPSFGTVRQEKKSAYEAYSSHTSSNYWIYKLLNNPEYDNYYFFRVDNNYYSAVKNDNNTLTIYEGAHTVQIIVATAMYNITLGTRPVDSISKLAGLWQGDINVRQEEQ